MSDYIPKYLSKNVYRYLMYLQLYNHCMSKKCLNCVFYFEWTDTNEYKHCYLVHDDWDSIKQGPGTLMTNDENPIFKTLLMTDEVNGKECINNCKECRFGVLTCVSGYFYSCAPFIDSRDLCDKIISYKGVET